MVVAPLPRARTRARIRRAWPHEAPVLSALAVRSKASWGYGPAEMAVFERELRVAPDALARGRAFVFEAGGRVAGFYTLEDEADAGLELGHLFVEPAFMGRGVGTRLLEHARAQARRAGRLRLRVQSDPHAERFYRMRGAVRLRLTASSIPGRSLPLLEIEL
ncbi:MAG: GNAT family N-acetyltransferase [Myxococcota bacterium]|nr:GNAT family N-acetyltransferase [Myxococcota bacterium]